jgi:hypothetical protein
MEQARSGAASSAQGNTNWKQDGADTINPILRPTSDAISHAINDTNANGVSDDTFVEDLLAELKNEEEKPSPSLPAPTRPKPPQAPRAAAPRNQERQPKPDSPHDKADEPGRVVLNHSTHVPGLLAVLHRLVETRGVRTAVPGRLYTAGGSEPGLALRVTVPIEGGFKLMARKGSQAQEVFVVTDLERETLLAAIAWAL